MTSTTAAQPESRIRGRRNGSCGTERREVTSVMDPSILPSIYPVGAGQSSAPFDNWIDDMSSNKLKSNGYFVGLVSVSYVEECDFSFC